MVLSHLLQHAHEAANNLALSTLPTLVNVFVKRANETQCPKEELNETEKIVFGLLIPILVVLSGVFAGLTLGYMSLDETQLIVLSMSGTEQQKKYAKKILPIRKNGHLLLITLILGNMIVNETLPVVVDPVFGGGVQAVVVSTALIVIFAEIIPQTLCTRYGLVIGAKMAFFVRVLIVVFWVIAYPVSKLLEFLMGPHHGIIYRRSELKELIAMHADDHPHGAGGGGGGRGELKHDTAAIIGHTLDLQEKVVKDAMTPISEVFMLSLDSVLDYATLTKIHKTGHSRIPVFTEITLPPSVKGRAGEKTKKIVGILLVKQCVLLDPEDATPLRTIPLNKVPPIAFDEPLLHVLDRFQEGRSHMAIVTKFSSRKTAKVQDIQVEVVKPALTRRFLNRFRDSDSSDDNDDDVEKGNGKKDSKKEKDAELEEKDKHKTERRPSSATAGGGKPLEQTMPADALLAKANADKFLQGLDQYANPMGIITLEDVLEELIGEEIYDEFDLRGAHALPASSYVPPEAVAAMTPPATTEVHPPMSLSAAIQGPASSALLSAPTASSAASPSKAKTGALALKMPMPTMPKLGLGGMNIGMGMLRTRSAPGTPRGGVHPPGTPVPVVVTPPSAGAAAAGDGAEKDKLDHIKEVRTPSPSVVDTERTPPAIEALLSEPGGEGVGPGSGGLGIVLDPPRDEGEERIRSSSTPPSPGHSSRNLFPVAQTPKLSNPPAATGVPTSLLTEAVLRGRQARLTQQSQGAHSDGTLTPGGTRTGAKGRFKSTPIDASKMKLPGARKGSLNTDAGTGAGEENPAGTAGGEPSKQASDLEENPHQSG